MGDSGDKGIITKPLDAIFDDSPPQVAGLTTTSVSRMEADQNTVEYAKNAFAIPEEQRTKQAVEKSSQTRWNVGGAVALSMTVPGSIAGMYMVAPGLGIAAFVVAIVGGGPLAWRWFMRSGGFGALPQVGDQLSPHSAPAQEPALPLMQARVGAPLPPTPSTPRLPPSDDDKGT